MANSPASEREMAQITLKSFPLDFAMNRKMEFGLDPNTGSLTYLIRSRG